MAVRPVRATTTGRGLYRNMGKGASCPASHAVTRPTRVHVETACELGAIPKPPRPSAVHTTDQIVSMASRLGWTVGITSDDLVGAQCRAVIGLAPQDEKFLAGENYIGVWHGTAEDARKRQEALDVVPYGHYQAMAVSPLASGRLNPPDICLVYATPGQMIILINGLQYTGYKKFEWGVGGETACADSWGRALKTGEPSLSPPCFAEQRYGGVPDEEMLMALQPAHLAKAITGMKQLAKNGLRYPIAPYGIQADVRAGMGGAYAGRKERHRHSAAMRSIELRCAIAHRRISRFSGAQLRTIVRANARPGMTG